MSHLSPRPRTNVIQKHRWLTLIFPATAGFLLLFLCFWALNSAKATGESLTTPVALETAALPAAQSAQGSEGFAVRYESDSDSVRHTRGVAWGDVDGDGDLDLAVGNGQYFADGYNQVNQLYINRSEVQIEDRGEDFKDFEESDIGDFGHDTRAVAWGDWDGDGDLDLAVANDGQANQVYVNVDGQLKLSEAPALGWTAPMSLSSTSLAWGDWDGDGDLDLAVGNNGSPNQVYQNISDTLILDPDNDLGWQSPLSLTLNTTGVAWADWDKDGDLDLTVANYDGVDQIYENISDTLMFDPDNGLGWQSPVVGELAPAPVSCVPSRYFEDFADPLYAMRTRSLAWGDWDNDGDLDLATGGGSDNNKCGAFINVYDNVSGTLTLDDQYGWKMDDATSLFKPASLAWGDWDGDGDLDLVVGNNAGGGKGKENQVYENVGKELRLNPGNNLGWQSSIEPGEYAETTYAIALADADGDGDLDLAVGNGGRRNKGQTNFVLQNTAPPVALNPVPWQSPDSQKSSSTAWGDWDGDGDLDLAVGNEGAPNQIYENEGGVLQFDPENGLGWQSTVVTDDLTTSVAWGDFNTDGRLDLAVGNFGQPDYVYQNQGGTLSLTLAGGLGWSSEHISGTQSLAWGDWDRDGDLDLAAGHCGTVDDLSQPQAAFVYENDGKTLRLDPDQGWGWISPEVLCARGVGWGDWNNDGALDLALGARVYENDAGQLRLGWNGNIDATSVAWGDVDGDGDLDLAVGTLRQNRVYRNSGGYFADAPEDVWKSFDIKQTQSLAWGDVDGDKDLDLAVANAGEVGYESNQIFENVGRTLGRRAVWRTTIDNSLPISNLITSHAVAWGDVDNDGDLDLALANACTSERCDVPQRPNHVYINTIQGNTTAANNSLTISIDEPYSTASADFYASPEVQASDAISLAYTLRDPHEVPVGRIEVQYSLDGGDNWLPAQPLSGTQTTNLETSASGTIHIFNWDTFSSNFFGQSDNVVMRMIAYAAPPAGTEIISGTYKYFNGVADSFQQPFVTDTSFPFRAQSTQIKVVDDKGEPVKGAWIYRLPAGQVAGAQLMPSPERPLATDEQGLLPGGGELKKGDRLVALQPISVTEQISFTNKYGFFHTSAKPTESGLDMFEFTEQGTIELQVSEDNPLLLFHIVMALEWDARDEESFQVELEDGIKRASELLYDVSDGQVALGSVRVFQSKEFWPNADVVVKADNSLRPLAPIGGIVQVPLSETVKVAPTGTKVISNAYVNSQIKMGTVWDPFGESSTDLGPDWWQALAHELAHYLLFLPDDYLGFKDGDSLGKINCQGSFMTSTYDPAYSEFLTEEEWTGVCENSLAERTTGRTDWETIRKFYPMLKEPVKTLDGPGNLPLEVTEVFIFDPQETRQTLRVRNFEVRDNKPESERLRLPAAQAYLFQTQGTPDLSDDILVQLGTPTGGGDRIKVRGAFSGDRLCLFDRSGSQTYAGCDDDLSASDISIGLAAVDNSWQPQIEVNPVTSRTMQITVTQNITDGADLNVQMFPAQYWSVPGFSGLSPTATMTSTGSIHTQTLTLRLPAYEVAVRVWVDGDPGRETVDQFRLNPPWESANAGPNSRLRRWSKRRLRRWS